MLVSYGCKLHMLPTSYYLAAQHEPYKEPLYLIKNAGECSGKNSGQWTISRKWQDRKSNRTRYRGKTASGTRVSLATSCWVKCRFVCCALCSLSTEFSGSSRWRLDFHCQVQTFAIFLEALLKLLWIIFTENKMKRKWKYSDFSVKIKTYCNFSYPCLSVHRCGDEWEDTKYPSTVLCFRSDRFWRASSSPWKLWDTSLLWRAEVSCCRCALCQAESSVGKQSE